VGEIKWLANAVNLLIKNINKWKGDFMKKLVIDLGHGGNDSGAVGQNKTYEADVVLAIGKELNQLLKNCELEVKFTRLENKYLSLSEEPR
jgi:N-acetylmuramoyl-L-alanine amidase